MEPLDLNLHRPRSPWAQLDGLYMMPRTIDKLRASLPGGNLGQYRIFGFSTRILHGLGISEDDLRAAVAAAKSDEDVAQWLREHADTSQYAMLNERLTTRRIADLDDQADYRTRYPVASELPPETLLFDVLDKDDDAIYSGYKPVE
jgi:hypothetical protein